MSFVLILHNLLRWLVLLGGLLAVIRSFNRWNQPPQQKTGLLFMISFDMQLLLGLLLYFVNGWGSQFQNGMKAVMQNPGVRFYAVEHIFSMIIAWILVHVGYGMAKRKSSSNAIAIIYLIALLLVIASIPWPFREAIGRPWFRF